MSAHALVSQRKIEHWASWHVVYEWEDIIARELGIQIECPNDTIVHRVKKAIYYHVKIANRLPVFTSDSNNWKLIWVMNAENLGLYVAKGNIPIFLDATADTADNVIRATKRIPVFFVTCFNYYNLLVSKGCENAAFMPLSISDKYVTEKAPSKTIDVLQFGRKNGILHDWMMQYCTENLGVEYVYQTGDRSLTYTSTIRGNIGKFNDRNEYMAMMKSAKVSLVSSPGCDQTKNFGGIDFITPRFYESVACGCHLVGRYTENEETELLNLSSVCPNVKTYDEFCEVINKLLTNRTEVTMEEKNFLKLNCTSKRAEIIFDILTEHGCRVE